jgi:hypothetical protein
LSGFSLKLEPRKGRGVCDGLQTGGSKGFKAEQPFGKCQRYLGFRILRKPTSDLLLRFDDQHIHPAAEGVPMNFRPFSQLFA